MALAPGREIGGYRLTAPVGAGGMGQVWDATDIATGERVALKLIKDAGSTPELRRRFAREVLATNSVQHPNVVKVHDVFETDDGEPVMVMEFLEGESLATCMARDKELSLARAAAIMLPVVSAVSAAHDLGIVHRDLKPENIFLTTDAQGHVDVRVLDFGIAKLVDGDRNLRASTGVTTTGSILGTPCYMAPEQVFGERDVDQRADIWAIGIILYHALTGILPTQADNVGQVLKVIVSRGIWPLTETAPDLPADVTELVDRMLSRDREDRPARLDEVAEVLARHVRPDTPKRRPVRRKEKPRPVSAVVPSANARRAPWGDRMRGRWGWISAVVTGTALLLGLRQIAFPSQVSVATAGWYRVAASESGRWLDAVPTLAHGDPAGAQGSATIASIPPTHEPPPSPAPSARVSNPKPALVEPEPASAPPPDDSLEERAPGDVVVTPPY
jgi:eukaryotic-like serine/threonine-protein kinase